MGRLRSLAHVFRSDRRGNVAMMFGLSIAPVIMMVGAAVDYTNAAMTRTKLNAAADAAALNVVSASIRNKNKNAQVANARDLFNAEAKQIAGLTVTKLQIDVNPLFPTIYGSVAYEAKTPISFGKLFGLKTITVTGTATAGAPMPTYADFHLLLDNSQSMGIAATPAGISKMETLFGCAFGCHVGGSTLYDDAKANNVEMRIDVMRNSVQRLMDKMTADAETQGQFRASLHTFSTGFQTLSGLTVNLSAIKTAAAGVDLSTLNSASVGETYYPQALSAVNAAVATPGSGSTAGNPKQFVFLVTDGVSDTRSPGNDHVTAPFPTGLCETLKSRGVTVGVLHTTYYRANHWAYDYYVRPFENQVAPQLQACASPGFYFAATDAAAIDKALQDMFSLATKRVRLTH